MTYAERETERLYRDLDNAQIAARRRTLYRTDPIWRMTKLKDNWERRERKRRGMA